MTPSSEADVQTGASAAAAARAFAVAAHGGQQYGGRPYAEHLDAVAGRLAPFGEAAQVVGYLHDVVEDTAVPLDAIRRAFGDHVAACVALVTDEPGADRRERKAKTNAKLAGVSGDAELALVVKAADRLANARVSAAGGSAAQLAMYRREHLAFRAAAYRPGLCDDLWREIDDLLAGGADDPAISPTDGAVAMTHPDPAGGRYRDELAAALAAARLAAAFALAEYERFTPIPDAPAAISTHVDQGAQELILGHLRERFPADGVLSEEDTPAARGTPAGAGRVWVVDPIDGTRGFARKTGEFSVMVGLTVGGRCVVGVVVEPVRGRVTYAAAGAGCWTSTADAPPTPCRVTTTADLAAAVLAQSHVPPGGTPKPVVVAIGARRVIETYSAGVKLALVARGEADLYVNDHDGFHDWDICAGDILVTEAGGTISLFDGSPVTYGGPAARRGGVVASNGTLHATTLGRVNSI